MYAQGTGVSANASLEWALRKYFNTSGRHRTVVTESSDVRTIRRRQGALEADLYGKAD